MIGPNNLGSFPCEVPGFLYDPLFLEVIIMKQKAASQERINEKEAKLIKLLRTIRSGEVRIVVQDGLPIRVEELHRSIELEK